MKNALHFIGFRDTGTFARACAVFGKPDFIHPVWDYRAQAEIMLGDKAIFAKGDENQNPTPYTYDDSSHW